MVDLDAGIDDNLQAEIDRDGIILYLEVPSVMKKFDAFAKCLDVLLKSNANSTDEIYRMGIIGQFHLTFELSWKALREVLLLHGVNEAASGSPREILKAAFKFRFISDEELWLEMLKRRNETIHIYNAALAEEFVALIFGKYIAAFTTLREELSRRLTA